MSARPCCQPEVRAADNERPPVWRWGGGGRIAGCMLPTAILAFLPKCPACVAVYVALATGVGISLSTATRLRTIVIIFCVACLMFVTAKILRDLFARKSTRVVIKEV